MRLIDKDAVISILKRDAADGDCMTLIADSTAREIEALPQNKGVTEENLADVLNCVDEIVGRVLESIREHASQSTADQLKVDVPVNEIYTVKVEESEEGES